MRFLAPALVFVVAGAAVSAGERYSFIPTERGVFRLDTETGEVSLCMERDATLVCLRAPALTAPPSAAFDTERDDRLAGLEARVSALEADELEAPSPAGGDTMRRVKALADHAMGRLFAMVREMKGETSGAL
jgi:hypothetical protein